MQCKPSEVSNAISLLDLMAKSRQWPTCLEVLPRHIACRAVGRGGQGGGLRSAERSGENSRSTELKA